MDGPNLRFASIDRYWDRPVRKFAFFSGDLEGGFGLEIGLGFGVGHVGLSWLVETARTRCEQARAAEETS